MIVDPGMSPGPLLGFLGNAKVSPNRILLTHGHGDHIAGANDLKEIFPAVYLCAPARDAHMLGDAMANMSAAFGAFVSVCKADELLSGRQEIPCGQSQWQVLDTPGHTPGSVSFYCPQAGTVITGDALFAGSIGRTDIPGASEQQLLDSIRTQLLALPDETRVLPGHGPASTIGHERRRNPFLR